MKHDSDFADGDMANQDGALDVVVAKEDASGAPY